MSRPARILSETGLYHIIFRGINRQNLFEEKQDYEKILEIITKEKEKEKFEIYAYCLMSNHVHLFIKEKNPGDIKRIMHSILTRYVMWYNYKYQRSGSLIGNRYKSEPIEDERYYFALTRYIHQNPIRAGIADNIKDYKWSSYNDYINTNQTEKITDTAFTLNRDIWGRTFFVNFSGLYREKNRLTSQTTTENNVLTSATDYTYDNNGNTLTEYTYTSPQDTGTTKTYSYDDFSRLTSYSDGTVTASYGYYADNLRAAKTIGNDTICYYWNGQNLSMEDGSQLNTYT